jgi:hypothetical protein
MSARRAAVIVFVLAAAVVAAAQRAYVCPMHPAVRGRQGDTCPICRMALVPAGPADSRPFGLDVAITPAAIRPQQPAHVRFLVRDPETRKPVHDFAVVHERVFHLFVVSRDLDYFAHVHPALRRSGALEVDVTVPRAGAYQLIADFVPLDGAPQLVQTSFATAGYASRVSEVPELAGDRADKILDRVRVSLTMPDAVAGREQLITFDLADAATGAPIADLEPFLGATGHLLLVSNDLEAVAHSHPVAGLSSGQSGPTVVFQHLFPRAGMYRMWAQFQRHGKVLTASFTVPVAEPPAR